MFPIRDDNPQFMTPVVTYAIVAINVAAWVLVQRMGSEAGLAHSLCDLGLIPGPLRRLPSRRRRTRRRPRVARVDSAFRAAAGTPA